MAGMSARAVGAVRRWDARLEEEHGPDAVWVAVSHADVIKAVLADALGMHLDAFQRLVVDPGSCSVVRYTPLRPFVQSHEHHRGGPGAPAAAPEGEAPPAGEQRRSRRRRGGQRGRCRARRTGSPHRIGSASWHR